MLHFRILKNDKQKHPIISLRKKDKKSFVISKEELTLKGKHNMVNVMASVLTGLLYQLKTDDMARDLEKFNNAPHRLELVEEINHVRFLNDSKATNVDSTYMHLQSFSLVR